VVFGAIECPPLQYETHVLGSSYLFKNENKTGGVERILVIFQGRAMFSHIS